MKKKPSLPTTTIIIIVIILLLLVLLLFVSPTTIRSPSHGRVFFFYNNFFFVLSFFFFLFFFVLSFFFTYSTPVKNRSGSRVSSSYSSKARHTHFHDLVVHSFHALDAVRHRVRRRHFENRTRVVRDCSTRTYVVRDEKKVFVRNRHV